jgi:hypothetical protein
VCTQYGTPMPVTAFAASLHLCKPTAGTITTMVICDDWRYAAAFSFDPHSIWTSNFMPPFTQPTFQERAALAAKAKAAALAKLQAKPPVDEAVLAQRREAAAAKEAALQKARQDKLAARAQEKAEKAAKAAEVAAMPSLTEEEQKRIRDAKYAARKNRAGKR